MDADFLVGWSGKWIGGIFKGWETESGRRAHRVRYGHLRVSEAAGCGPRRLRAVDHVQGVCAAYDAIVGYARPNFALNSANFPFSFSSICFIRNPSFSSITCVKCNINDNKGGSI